MSNFQTWWDSEGSAMRPLENEDLEEFAKRVTEIAWSNGGFCAIEVRKAFDRATELAEQPAPVQQEHVADALIRQYINALVSNKPDEAANVTKAMVDYVYTTPQAQPAREWVGLTDEDKCTVELDEAEVDPNWIDGYKSGLKDAEAKLREKNT